MTVTAEQAKALLDAAKGTIADIEVGQGWSERLDNWTRARKTLFAAAPDLAATVVELHERLGSQTEQSSALQSEVDGLRSRLASVEAERDAAVAESVIERDATTHIVYEHSQQSIEMTSLRSELERLRTNFAESVERNMNATTERATMVAAHRAREGRLKDAEKVAAQSVAKLKTLGYRLDAVRQELTARAEKAEAERDKLARWKAEAKVVIAGWIQVWHTAGRPGALGESTSAATAKHIDALQAAIDKVLALHIRDVDHLRRDHRCRGLRCVWRWMAVRYPQGPDARGRRIMSKHITVTLLNGTKTEYTYVDITTVHDGVLSIELGRDNWVTYPLTSILKWEARHV